MYHDDREINADKLIETLEAQVKRLTSLHEDARLLLMLVIVARIGKPSNILYTLSQKLMEPPVLASIKLSEFSSLLHEAENLIEPGEDADFLITHLAAKAVSLALGIDYRHPKLVAALVGTIQSTLSTPLFEAIPSTAELSLGLLGDYPQDSFPMSDDVTQHQWDLISIRLAAMDIRPNFIAFKNHRRPAQSTVLLDAPYPDPTRMLYGLQNMLDDEVQGRLVLIHNWTRANMGDTWSRLYALIENRAQVEAVIAFSSLPTVSDYCTAIIINTAPIQRETLYIDVSLSNKSLPPLDGIERMLLAGCIYNLWQGRVAHSHFEYLSSDVRRFLNSYFSAGFRPISRLCNAIERRPGNVLRTVLTKRLLLKAASGESSRRTRSDNSKLIADVLERRGRPCCVYIIGNNGEGKSFLLTDIAYLLVEAGKRCVGLPLSHADRFPVDDGTIKHLFEYKGARRTQITKEVSAISSAPGKVELLRECLGLVGFRSLIYLILKSELSHDRFGVPRRETLDLSNADDMRYFNRDRSSTCEYEVNFIREGHRTISFDNLSSGEQSIIGLLIKIIASDADRPTFLIDEPEISLHVSWQQRLPRIFNLLSDRLNVSFVIATHSPILIANAADDDICYVSSIGILDEIPVIERHSVETLLMDGFETYTPHNREVHEQCAKLVASLISDANTPNAAIRSETAIQKLKTFKTTIQKNGQGEDDERQATDLDLIEKTLAAIMMLREESEPRHG
ncbi:AAA family ATPase [Pseudomonas sp. Z3-8]|uniref:AAA family ATPase n=1 Tax=Pseudomonas sp. Z3-8 TaxID=2817412 RepID=UPI003DA8F7AF